MADYLILQIKNKRLTYEECIKIRPRYKEYIDEKLNK